MKLLASFTRTYWNTPIISVIKDTCAFPSMTLKTSVIKKHFLIRQKHNDNNFLNGLTPKDPHTCPQKVREGQLQPRLLPIWLKDIFMLSVDRH